MRPVLLVAVLLVAVPAASGATVRHVSAPAPVQALAVDGRLVAYAAALGGGDCDRVRIWNLGTRGVTTLGRSTSCEVGSTGTGIASLALAGSRVLWLHYAGGNIREWSLFTATATRRTPRRLAFVSRDVDARLAPIVIGQGDGAPPGGILPYALDRTVVALRADGARRFAWTAPAPVTALAARGTELAVATAGGLVTVLDASGRERRSETFTGEVDAVRLTDAGILVQRGRTLEHRTESGSTTWPLPRNAGLQDAGATTAYYVTGRQLRELRLDAVNRQRLVGLGAHVQVEGATLAIAAGRRVSVTSTGG